MEPTVIATHLVNDNFFEYIDCNIGCTDCTRLMLRNENVDFDKSFAIQAGREIRVMVVPEQVSDADMVLLARDISKQIEAELEYPGQIKVNVIRESRVTDYAK